MPAMNYARVAEKYDQYVKSTFDLPFFLEEARKAGRSVLELMAGTGRVTIALLEAGIQLTCVDSSLEMLAVLRRKLAGRGLQAEVVQQDVIGLDLPQRYALIMLPFHSFSELLTLEDQRKALERIHAHLAEGGRFICTLHNPPVRMKSEDGRLRLYGEFPLPEDGTLLLWGLSHYTPGNPLVTGLQLYEEYNAEGIMWQKTMLDVRFRLVEKDEFAALAIEAGFTVAALYGNYDRSPFEEQSSPFVIWELTR
ncbi:MAG: class I SAM-dependent methyltransferase [Armatimonadota bacterium]